MDWGGSDMFSLFKVMMPPYKPGMVLGVVCMHSAMSRHRSDYFLGSVMVFWAFFVRGTRGGGWYHRITWLLPNWWPRSDGGGFRDA